MGFGYNRFPLAPPRVAREVRSHKGRGQNVRFASVALDISTRALEGTFDYAIPEAIEGQVTVGATVLVPFSHRSAVGYVMATSDEPPADVAPSRLLAVAQVLAPSAFGPHSAAVAHWIAHEYACPLADAVRLFLAPGQKVRVTRESPDAPWELVAEKAAPADARAGPGRPGLRARAQRELSARGPGGALRRCHAPGRALGYHPRRLGCRDRAGEAWRGER